MKVTTAAAATDGVGSAAMADAYAHILLVDIEENNVPKLKIKLVKYFQSRKSCGGDCEVVRIDGSRTAEVRFRSEEDRKNVLAKKSHQISLDSGVLRMTVRLPTEEKPTKEAPSDVPQKKSDVAESTQPSSPAESTPEAEAPTEEKGGNDETADEELCSTSAVLGNISEELTQEFLEMLVENVLLDTPSSSQGFNLEVIPDTSFAVVTFQSVKENTDFVEKCPLNRTFQKKKLSVQPLEVTDKIVAEDIQNLNEDLLRLYFENAGGDVEDIELNEQSAIITFKDPKAVQKILKKKHHLKKVEIRVYPFYKSLGIALYGKDKPPLRLPAAFSEPIDDAVWRYLNGNQSAAASVQHDMEKHFCNVNLSRSSVWLSPCSSLLQKTDAKTLVKEWTDTVKSAFAQALSKFRSLKLRPEMEIWEESEKDIRQTLVNAGVVVVSDKANGVLSVAGPVADVNRLEQTLVEVIQKIVRRVHREKSTVTQEIKVPRTTFNILCKDGLKDRLLSVYPELKMSFGKGSSTLTATGLRDEILSASKVLYDEMLALKRQNLVMEDFVLDLLKEDPQEELTDALLTSLGINAAFEVSGQRLQLLAASDEDLKDAEDHLRSLLIRQCINVEDSKVLRLPKWNTLLSQLKNDNSKPCRRIGIRSTNGQVVVCGHKDSVIKVCNELDDFLTQNAQVEETVAVKPDIIVAYIQTLDKSWLNPVRGKVEVSFKKEAVCLSGPRCDVATCKTLINTLVSSIFFGSTTVLLPGAKKTFKDKESMYIPLIKHETNCLVQLVEVVGGGQDNMAHSQAPKPVYQFQTSDGVEIAVCKADMCRYPVHAIVNASSRDMKHSGGLAGAILKAAGPQLQDECDRLISLNGDLKPGDTVVTNAGGQLCCQKVIHAVGPTYDPIKSQKAVAQLKRAVKGSLELAEKRGCTSVALPAISRNQNFPINLCAETIVKAVKEHCDDKYDDNSVKKIHFVNNDDAAVQAMLAAVRQVYGNQGVVHSQQSPPAISPKPPSVKQGVSDPNCLGQVQTKEGLDISLIKGAIENATTEVIVNTVFEDLNLNKGAVSNAIFGVAGPNLQQLVNPQNAQGNVGDVIVTDGCNLKSKKVFHAVTPHYDKGKGSAEKTLKGIFRDCLDKAESSGLTSISIPAIGTGNLGFPKDVVVTLMLDEILAFSSKKPKHLKKAMIVLYSGDAQTIQVFSDEFKKKFPSASVVQPQVASTQTSGPFSKVVSSTGMHETKMGNVVLQVATGDITKETTDVIVNSSNESFTLKSGVSKAVLEAAGQAVETECQNLGAQPNSGMIMTQPGNLKCKKILHLVGQTDPVKINKAVKDALQMCVSNSFTSVSFPAIGTGQGNVQARQVADAMLDAAIDVLSQNTSSTLKTIRIVIFQPPMLKEFYNSMHQRETPDPAKAGFWGNLGSKIKSLFTATPDKPQKDQDFVIEPLKVEPACFHVCGDSQARVESAKQKIKDLISKEQYSISIPDNAIHSFSADDYIRIVDIQRDMMVSIKTENKNNQASVTIEGLSQDVLKASHEIHDMLKRAREKEDLKAKVEMASNMVDWQYQQQGLQFQSFSAQTNFELEQALEKKIPSVKVIVQGQTYTVAMPGGPATDNQGRILQIKRIDKLKDEEIPEAWDTMPANTSCLAVPIKAGTPEYTDVESRFRATCGQAIIKIERIQNPVLWKSLQIKKNDMEKRNGHQQNEKRLFHGTCHTTVAYINEHGFNRSYAGKNAAMYGNGTYFAVNASYSANRTYSKPKPNGEQCMYLCRVLTGDFTLGKQGMIVPPTKTATSVHQFDSVVDNMANPTMYIIFHDSHAYPEYLITFK